MDLRDKTLLQSQLETAENESQPLIIAVGLTLSFVLLVGFLSSLFEFSPTAVTILNYISALFLAGFFLYSYLDQRRKAFDDSLIEIGRKAYFTIEEALKAQLEEIIQTHQDGPAA